MAEKTWLGYWLSWRERPLVKIPERRVARQAFRAGWDAAAMKYRGGAVVTAELDAEVAEKVFGMPRQVIDAQAFGPMRYSSTWSGAEDVIERLRRMGMSINLASPEPYKDGALWHAYVYDREPCIIAGATAPTFPEAVSRAALKAVGVQGGGDATDD